MPVVIPSIAPTVTGLSLINRAAEIIGYKDPDETLGTADRDNFLAVLNDMIDGWNTQRMFIVSVGEIIANVSGLPVSIGPGGTIDVPRPMQINSGSFIRISDIDYGIKMISQDQYNSIAFKSQDGPLAFYGFYDAAVPYGNLYLWPYPSATAELHLMLSTQLTEFADTTTEYNLAQGYRKAISYSLAEELAVGRRPIQADVQRIAAAARKAIRRLNVEPLDQNVGTSGSYYAAFMAGL